MKRSTGIKDTEDYYLAAGVAEKVRDGKDRIFTAQELRRELELDR